MSDSSFIPERQLVFSPGLAATIGLEAAILLQQLQQLFDHLDAEIRGGYAWLRVEGDYLQRALPFWGLEDLQRITRDLADMGILLIESAPLQSSATLVFAVNQPVQRSNNALTSARAPAAPPAAVASASVASTAATPAPSAPSAPSAPAANAVAPLRRSAGLLPVHWAPSEDMLQLLGLNHNIPRQFALDQLEDFIFYWRERGETSHAWENKFRQHVTSNWRRHQQDTAESFRVPEKATLDNSWRPSLDALEIMERGGIERDFIEQSIPEFILYWRERGAPPKELNSRFIQHIRIQWAKYTSSLEHSTEPKRISDEWLPTEDVFDILRMSHIDTGFAHALLPEFIIYWKDSNQAHTSWNSKFLQHVKYHWAKRHQMEQADQGHAGHQRSNTTGRTRDRSIHQDLTDTSWAE